MPPPPVVIPPPKQRKQVSQRTRKRRRAIIVLLLVILLGLGSFFGAKAFIAWRFTHVPKVSGATEQSAIEQLRHAGYKPEVQPGAGYSDTVSKGRVISTDPSGGTRVTTGKTVTITLSAGPQMYEIPRLTNSDPNDALNRLIGLGLTAVSQHFVPVYSTTVQANSVVGTVPKAGTRITRAQPVVIHVSKGPPSVKVPDISTDTPLSVAKDELHNSKFRVRTIQDYSDTVDVGDVISVDPKTSATLGSVVTVTVSEGPQMVTIPDIAFATSADVAKAQLNALGLNVVESETGDRADPGVYDMKPEAGKSVAVGSTVTLFTF